MGLVVFCAQRTCTLPVVTLCNMKRADIPEDAELMAVVLVVLLSTIGATVPPIVEDPMVMPLAWAWAGNVHWTRRLLLVIRSVVTR